MKNIYKKVVLIAFIFFCSFRVASAGVVINEVAWMGTEASQYEEWIELKNTGSESVSLDGWKLYKTKDALNNTLLYSLSGIINPSDYFLVCRTTANVSNPLSGSCDSNGAFGGSGLNNTSDTLELKNSDGARIDFIDGREKWPAGDSNTKQTMQWNGSSWVSATPTPGKENTLSVGNTNNEQNEQTEGSTTTSSSSSSNLIKTPQPSIVVEAILKNSVVFAGLGTKFQGKVSRDGEALFYGRYFWNFGDGSSEEMKVNTGGEVSHVYFYPGEYALSLEYYTNDYGDIPEASYSMVVKVIGADILISNVGKEQDFFIELSNNTEKDVDIGKWMLTSGDKRFVFPKNTIISAKKKITFSPFVTGFIFSDKNNLKLVNQDWKTVFDYALSVTPTSPPVAVNNSKSKVTVARSAPIKNTAIAESLTTEFVNQTQALDETSEVLSTSLSAQAISSKVAGGANKKILYYIILLALLLAGGGAIYFIRRSKRQNLETVEDFEILDE